MSTKICQTCSSTIPPALTSTIYTTPCCDTPICRACLNRNPRLRHYNPCLQCDDPTSSSYTNPINLQAQNPVEDEQFVLGDEDEEEDGKDGAPPEYREMETTDRISLDPNAGDKRGGEAGDVEEEMEVVEVRHNVLRSDTILSIARKYAADPHEILILNNLPPTTLTSQPHLLRLRPSLLISRKYVPASLTSHSTPLPDPDSAKREKERAIKRFQLLTKTVDPGVGRAYISLSELEGDKVDEGGEGMDGKKVPIEGVGIEERALGRFYGDEEWEREVGAPERGGKGRWKSVGSGVGGSIKI